MKGASGPAGASMSACRIGVLRQPVSTAACRTTTGGAPPARRVRRAAPSAPEIVQATVCGS